MAAGDREAELKLKTTLEGGAKAAEDTKAIRTETEKLGESAAEVAGDLNREASALDDVSQATAKTTQEAQEARGAIEGMGAAGAAAGQEIAQGAGVAAASVAAVGPAAETAGSDIKKAADVAERNIETVTKAFRDQAQAIRDSKAPLDEQKAKLRELEEEVQKLSGSLKGAPGINEIVAQSLTDVRTRITEVDAELVKSKTEFTGLSAEARAAMESIKPSILSVDDALLNAVRAIGEVEQKFAETGNTSPREMVKVSQAVEASKLALEQHAKTAIVSPEQIAAVQVLEGEVERLNERTNRLTNAGKDNAIALQEQGQQAAGLASAAQGIVHAFDVQQITTTALLGKTVGLSLAYERLKDSVKTLNINQLGAARGALGLGAQITALAATIAGAVTVGLKLAGMSETNREVMDDWAESLRKWRIIAGDVFGQVADRIGAIQTELQKLAGGVGSVDALNLAMSHGSEAARNYYEIVREGATTEQARRFAVVEAEAAERAHREEIERSISTSGKASQAQRENASAHGAATEATRAHTTAVNEYASAERRARDAVVQTSLENIVLERAVNGTTSAISLAVENIARLIGASDENSVALGRYASALLTAASDVDGLTAAQRAQIQAVADLAKRGNELTDAERRRVIVLAEAITSGRTITDTLKQQAEATGELTGATNAQTEAELAAKAATDERRSAIESELQSIREQIDLLRQQTGAVQEHGTVSVATAGDIAYLEQKERALQRELETSITVWNASSDAAGTQKDARAELAEVLAREASATRDVGTATQATTVIRENGRKVITNLTTAQREAAGAAREEADAQGKAKVGHEEAAVAMQKLRDQVVPLPADLRALAEVMPAVASNIREARDAAREYADEMDRAAGATKRMNDEAARAASE